MKKILPALVMSLMLAAPVASAASANGTLTVTANVNVTCSVNSPTLAFGTFTVGTDDDAQTDIVVTCSSPVVGTVALGGTPGSRVMNALAPAVGTLNYELYTDSARTAGNEWGSATTPTMALDSSAAGAGTTTLTVFGRIPAASNPTPANGGYQATETITVNY